MMSTPPFLATYIGNELYEAAHPNRRLHSAKWRHTSYGL